MGMTSRPLGLYVHFPFCKRKCSYCAFLSIPLDAPVRDYTDAVIHELESFVSEEEVLTAVGNRKLASVYFGGGTPSLWPAGHLERILNVARKSLGLDSSCEVSIEVNPGTADARALQEYRKIGINRISIGVQSLDDSFLRLLGRLHDSTQAKESVRFAENAGFQDISIDLMFGLPGQTPAMFEKDLQAVASLGCTHLSLYELTLESGTPLRRRVEQGEVAGLPDDDIVASMLDIADTRLSALGFDRYEVSNLAKEGKECRHNSLYWSGGDYLAAGPAGVTLLYMEAGRAVRWTNTREIPDYMSRGRKAGTKEVLGPRDITREGLLTGLRFKKGIDLKDLAKRAGVDPLAGAMDRIRMLEVEGFLTLKGDVLAPTRLGMNLADRLALELSP
ncbi:MAG: radical SAM family heme chaperone HemW [Deltaproteobacteria bacterium]|nr:radical SAM family heme chaperone HemW [Deltaproteobacteria bacterium]